MDLSIGLGTMRSHRRTSNIGSDSISVAALWRQDWRGTKIEAGGFCSNSGRKIMMAGLRCVCRNKANKLQNILKTRLRKQAERENSRTRFVFLI